MRVAYLIDNDGIGGGMQYIRSRIASSPDCESRIFFSDRGECTAARVNAWRPDRIHANHLKALLQLFANPFVRPACEVIFTVHGIHLRKYDFLPDTPANAAKRKLRLSLERWLYRKCATVIALTPTDARDIARLYGAGLHIEIEPNSIDASRLPAPSGLRYAADSFAFACIARFDFQKGQDILLEAIRAARDELGRRGARTLLIGGGETLEPMRRFAEANGIGALVEFAGPMPDAGVYMTCARTLVAPSRWEGMPYLLLEAVARGRRVIASDCPGNRDVLAGYGNAELFANCDVAALAELLAR